MVLLAGCAAEEPAPPLPAPPAFAEWSQPATIEGCGERSCFEPSVAALPSGRFAVLGQNITVVDGNGTVQDTRERPPAPDGRIAVGDGIVQTSSDGELFWSDMVFDPQTRHFVGVAVARSDDEGATWTPTAFVPSTPVAAPEPLDLFAAPLGVDRQWLAFGGNGTVYVEYAQQDCSFPTGAAPVAPHFLVRCEATGIWVARSDDGGETFGRPVLAVHVAERNTLGQAGLPAVDAAGRLALPFIAYGPDGSGNELRIAISEDGGASFTSHHVAPGPAFSFATAAAAGEDLLASWWTGDATVLASSTDHGVTWSAPVPWTTGRGSGFFGPALLVNATGLRMITYTRASPEPDAPCDLVAIDGTNEGPAGNATAIAQGIPAVVFFEGARPRACATDYASAARSQDGTMMVTWASGNATYVRAQRG